MIYDWIVANVKYEVPGAEGRDAESVLKARRGDCEQFSVLMTAMCRSVGIPARTVTNAWTTGGSIYGPTWDSFRPPLKSPIANLYLAGSGVWPGPGIEAVVISGVLAADAIFKSPNKA